MSAERFELIGSAAQTASANSAAHKVSKATMAQVNIDITATSGTPSIDVWLQGSGSKDGPWLDVPYDQQMSLVDSAADLTANTNKRNINGAASATAAGKHMATYKHLAFEWVRLKWKISGGTPSVTFSATLHGK